MTPFGCREIQVDDEPPTDQQKLDELKTKLNFLNSAMRATSQRKVFYEVKEVKKSIREEQNHIEYNDKLIYHYYEDYL